MKPNSKIECDKYGNIRYHQDDKLHRKDGPAVEYVIGDKYWYQKDQYHRLDGPAIELSDGTKFWYIEGEEYTEEEFLKKLNKKESCEDKIVEIDGKNYKLTSI